MPAMGQPWVVAELDSAAGLPRSAARTSLAPADEEARSIVDAGYAKK